MAIDFSRVGIAGTGAMGQGIAQIAAQAGSRVLLFDSQSGAAERARQAIGKQWQRMQDKGRLDAAQRVAMLARLEVADSIQALAGCDLVIEAIVERLDIKQQLLRELEAVVDAKTVLATNTSSLPVTAIGAALKHPQRLAGFHFFNPVALMKVAEVVAGLRTDTTVCERLMRYAQQMGHRGVLAQDTPGFIVNHAGRGYGTEALRIASESVADFATIDRVLKDQAGFRLGPFELLDLTGLDISQAVMESIYHQYYAEPRYRPSVIGTQRVAAGLYGRKTGEGFYRYVDGQAQTRAETPAPQVHPLPPVWIDPQAARREQLLELVRALGAPIENQAAPSAHALILVAPLGLDMTCVAVRSGLDAARTVGIDMLADDTLTQRRALATTPATRADMRDAAHALFARDGKAVSLMRDSPGFITQRVVAAIVNIACDICQQGICTPDDLDAAVRLGLNYPQGPLAMGDRYGAQHIMTVLSNMESILGDPRYRPSPWLRRRSALGLSLLHTE
ncbi:MAG: 3-hydroxyacyl-CoA dehydrogenase [Burkholderiaceae bacterium]|jgi:3-hydroxybutyryl-CoA dehydrogenase|nr:3-hydroxyacyl-CoA dehydrogenase [Burkholderiaceae bacterium]